MSTLVDAISNGDLQLPLPQTLRLRDDQTLHCDQLLRLLPGKRGVFEARFGDQIVLAKIFLDSASRQIAREQAGYERLVSAKQPTPKHIATIGFDGGSVLLFQFLNDAQPLFRGDSLPSDIELCRLLDRLQSMYANGIYHDDLHWGNFLWHEGIAYVIDAGAIEGTPPQPLTPETVIDNLGILIAQFYRCDQDHIFARITQHALFEQFQLSATALKNSAETHWHRRKQALLQKCFRNTTAHHYTSAFDRVFAYRRAYSGPDLDAFLQDPDSVMARGQALKLGNSATVAKLTLDGRTVVIKRYNVKNVWHWLRRCCRPSRAWTSWRNAHRLELLGLHTPAPIAFLEIRSGLLRRRAYYICEFIDGDTLTTALKQREPTAIELAELEKYFTVAALDHLVHGDMKATNFLLQDNRLFILDLDAMHEDSSSRWKKLCWQDFSRFKRNWETHQTEWLLYLSQHVRKLIEHAD